jgi:hypothetical protein
MPSLTRICSAPCLDFKTP